MGQMMKSDENRTMMSQMKDKNSTHTKGHQRGVDEDDLRFVQSASK